RVRAPAVVYLLRTLLAGEKRSDLGHEVRGDRHQRDVLRLARRLDVGKFLILGLVLVMGDEVLDALLIPPRGELLFAHFGFLLCRRRKALLAFPCGSYAVITKTLSGSASGT